jgi:2'-5' RNA ligase
MQVIDRIRSQYDPLARYVRPHITLVFPFESDISTPELQAHMSRALAAINPFEVVMSGVAPSRMGDHHLFLLVHKGAAEIAAIHDRLYQGILQPFYPDWLRGHTYLPHMTLGHFSSKDELEAAQGDIENKVGRFQAVVHTVCGEIIDENDYSIPEVCVPLRGAD